MQSEIERLRSLAWDNLKALTAVDQDVTISTDYTGAKGYGSFSMKRTISGTGETRKIVLVITWTDLSGAAHSKSYVTQYTKGGLYDYIQ